MPSDKDGEIALRYSDPIMEELNIKAVKLLQPGAELVEYKLKPVDTLGRELRKDFPAVRKLIVDAQGEQVKTWGKALMAGNTISVEANGKTFDLGPEHIIVQQTGAEGFAVAENAGFVAALSTELSEALVHEGLAREVVRRIQQLRKDADLDIADRIDVTHRASERLQTAIENFRDYIATETLAARLTAGDPSGTKWTASDEFDGETLSIGIKKA